MENEEVADAVAEAENLKQEYDDLVENDPDNEEAIQKALDAYEEAQAKADKALADAGAVTENDIADMRADGMGWGDICHELGLHPSILGLGHYKDKGHPLGKHGEESLNTDRDLETASVKGHSQGHSKGKGLGLDKSTSGHPGKGKGKGKGGGKGGGKK